MTQTTATAPPSTSARWLPPAEWDRLTTIEPFATRGLPTDPQLWRVLVVEQDGQIVGTCSVFTCVHWDAWNIAPEHRTRGVVLRQLLAGALQLFEEGGLDKVYTGAEDAQMDVQRLLVKFGFQPVAGKLYVLTVAEAAIGLAKET